MAARKKATLLAQGKERRLGDSGRPWRVRLYAPSAEGKSFQVFFKSPTEDGEWKRVLRRANTEKDARKIFDLAEKALDNELSLPASAPERATRTIEALAAEYLADSEQRGKTVRTIQGRESRVNAHIIPAIGSIPVAKWRVEHSRKVMERGSKTIHSVRGREDLRGAMASMRKLAWRLGWLDRSIDPLDGLEIGR